MLMLTPISDKLILRDRSDNATDPKMRVADNVYELYRLGGAVSALSKKLSDKQPYQITFTDIYFEVNALQPLLAIVIEG